MSGAREEPTDAERDEMIDAAREADRMSGEARAVDVDEVSARNYAALIRGRIEEAKSNAGPGSGRPSVSLGLADAERVAALLLRDARPAASEAEIDVTLLARAHKIEGHADAFVHGWRAAEQYHAIGSASIAAAGRPHSTSDAIAMLDVSIEQLEHFPAIRIIVAERLRDVLDLLAASPAPRETGGK